MNDCLIRLLRKNWADISVLWYDDEYVDPYDPDFPQWSCYTCASFIRFINDASDEYESFETFSEFEPGFIYEFGMCEEFHHFMFAITELGAVYIDYHEEVRPNNQLLIKFISIADIPEIINFWRGQKSDFAMRFLEIEVEDECSSEKLFWCRYRNKYPTADKVIDMLLSRVRDEKNKTDMFEESYQNLNFRRLFGTLVNT